MAAAELPLIRHAAVGYAATQLRQRAASHNRELAELEKFITLMPLALAPPSQPRRDAATLNMPRHATMPF